MNQLDAVYLIQMAIIGLVMVLVLRAPGPR
jgi:hypothetical protein